MIDFIIRRPVMVSMIILGFCLLGIISYTKLPVELIPYAEFPVLFVQVGTIRDADPDYVEKNAIIPIESAIAELEDIERIESYIDRRRAIIFVYYTQGANLKYGYLKLQEKIAAAQSNLGSEFFARVWKIDTELLTNQFMSLQARGEGGLEQIRQVIDDKVLRELESVDGIANIEIYGGRQQSIEVILNEDALRGYNITPSQISSRISQGSGARRYLGLAYEGNRKYFVNLTSDYDSLTNLEDIVISDTGPVLLKHVATIVDGGAEEESIARINGMEAITISLIRDQEVNLLSLSRQTRQAIKTLNRQIASDGIELVIQDDAAEVIENNIEVIKSLALIGGLLAIAVLWIFLRNLALVIVVAAAIPVSVIISLNLFYAFDITINTLTLVGIAIAIGMLLDNSIVVLENIHRHLGMGKNPRQAVIVGTGEVWRAVSAATLTTVCVFIPFLFSNNFLVVTLGKHIGVSIISTLLVSLAAAFLIIPVFTYRFLSRREKTDRKSFNIVSQKNRLMQIYTLLLKSCFRYPARTIIVGVVALFASIIICLGASINIPEEVELSNFNLYATMPSGTTLESADEMVREMDKQLSGIVEVEERLANIQEDNLSFTFNLVEDYKKIDGRDINEIKQDIINKLSTGHPRINFSYQQPTSSSRYRGGGSRRGGGGRMERLLGIGASEEKVIIRGQDIATLRTIADDIRFNIDNLETIRNSNLSISNPQPGIDLLFDRSALNYFSVTPDVVAAELASFQKEISVGARFKRGNQEIDIILKSDNTEDRKSDDLRELRIPSSDGGTVPLLQLANLVYTDGSPGINRVNQEKQIELTYNFQGDIEGSKKLLDNARLVVDQLVADIALPPGVSVEVIHDETDLSEFYFLIVAAVILIYMILASVFESPLIPLAMMFTIPLATIGAFWGLILTGKSIFNANALIGFLILLGVVVNNGIILIDYSRLLQKRKYRPARALLMAGQARVRPILITAVTTILAMLPLAMGKAEYVGKIGAPFAITVIGGLIAGTLFTLILVPTVSFGLANAMKWWRGLSLTVRFLQLAALASGLFLIYHNVDSTLWRMANASSLFMVIPAFTYLAMKSLRHTRTQVLPQAVAIKINIRNVVKYYDNYSRFVQEWHYGRRLRERMQKKGISLKATELKTVIWQIPLYLFHFYYAYFYLENGFWIVAFTIAFHLFTIRMYRLMLMQPKFLTRLKSKAKYISFLYRIVFWLLPLANLAWYLDKWDNPVTVSFIGFFWYLSLTIYQTSRKLYSQSIDINRLPGRFKRTRKTFYRFVKTIPVIGKKKVPFRALFGVSLEIESGMFGLIGPNGAGKTTLMRIICGILQQDTGKVSINGLDLDEHREELQSLIGYLPQEFGTYENMTARQFLEYQALLKGLWNTRDRRQVVDRAINSVHLYENRNIKIKNFSGGMKQRVGIAQTLLHLPRILVVDEPTAGLDPRERIRFRNLLSELARNRIVIFSTHIIEDISSSCNRVAVLYEGRVRFLGTPEGMVQLTRGYVWQARVPQDEFEEVRKNLRVVHHMPDGKNIRVRILAARIPIPGAVEVTPTLEDSYLWLLDKKEVNGHE